MPEQTITMDEINAALLPVSREHGYCLCIRPMMTMVNFSGTSCTWCLQPCTDEAYTPEAKAIRTAAVKAAYPEKVKSDD
jgi:hypothetical protein